MTCVEKDIDNLSGVNQIVKNKIYELKKGEGRIQILKLARFRSKNSLSKTNFLVQWYHGCDTVNRISTRKLIDYQ